MPEREGLGRRQQDTECANHDARLTEIENEHNRQAGWMKAAAGFASIAIAVIGYFGMNIISKLSTIESLLNKSDVAIARMDVTVQNHEQRLKDIETRHNIIDSSSYRKAGTK